MFKKIRKFVWKLKDTGQGFKAVLAVGMMIVLTIVTIVVALLHRNTDAYEKNAEIGEAVVSETVTGQSDDPDETLTSETVEESEFIPEERATEPVTEEAVREIRYENFDNLRSFLPENKYDELADRIRNECDIHHVSGATQLSYQISDETNMTIIFFVRLEDGTVYQCTYSFSSSYLSVEQTSFTEDDINSMKEEKERDEQEKLEKERKKIEKQLEKERKKKEKKKKKSATDGG